MKARPRSQTVLLSVAMATASCLPAEALAQAAPTQTSGTSAPVADNRAIDNRDIVVTALRRDTTLRDTPAAITSIGGDALREQHVTSLTDLSTTVPGLQIGEAGGVSLVTIRGISLDALIGGIESSIALYRDGVYLSQATPLDFLLMDVGRVEVLRGPQGTLYGRNATGGAINITPARPTQELSGFITLSAGNLGSFREEAALSGPIIADKLLIRVAGLSSQRRDGYAVNDLTGDKLGTNYEDGVRGTLEAFPAGNVDLRLDGFYFAGRNTTDFWTNRESVSAFQTANNPDFANHPASLDPRRPTFDFSPEDVQTDQGGSLSAKWDLSRSVSLTSLTSYTDLDYQRRHADCDGTATPTCNSSRADRSRSFQQELDLGIKAGPLSGVLGGFYDHDRLTGRQTFPFNNPTQGFVVIDGSPVPNGAQIEQISRQRTDSVAVFGDGELKLAPWVSLYGGARYTHDSRTIVLTSGLGLTFNDAILLGCTAQPDQVSYSNVSGKAGIQFHPNTTSQFYGQWQQGFKAGGFNTGSCGSTFRPEHINAYEVGYKARLFDGLMDTALSAFHYDYNDLQTAQIVGVSYSITNAATAKVDGAEIELTARPASGLQIDGHGTYLNARYGRYFNFDPINLAAGEQDLSGKRLNRAPRFSGTLGLQYGTAIGRNHLTARGELTYTSDYFFRPFNEGLDRQDGYMTGNAFLTYELAGSGVQLRAFVRNIADKTILAGVFTSDLTQTHQAQYQLPRTFGGEVTFRFK
ncbi:TonB-dependent receptor [Sphingomonas bacterium]|uniref:TonB-dependent receptor n=1 Tax=Sphingomonas bacterium TaxID=1895847 RepID=UPI0015763262|nr:TonB-dependent receptor [Sphingomonas bacterium]